MHSSDRALDLVSLLLSFSIMFQVHKISTFNIVELCKVILYIIYIYIIHNPAFTQTRIPAMLLTTCHREQVSHENNELPAGFKVKRR